MKLLRFRSHAARKGVAHFVASACIVFAAPAVGEPSAPAEKQWPEGNLRGLCVGKPRIAMTREATFQRMSDWDVNALTVNFAHDERLPDLPPMDTLPEVPPHMEPYRGGLHRLDRIVSLAKKYNMVIVLAGGAAVGVDKINVAKEEAVEKARDAEWAYLDNVMKLHRYLGRKYVNEPALLAYNFISEPHTPAIVENWQTRVVPEFIETVRSVDRNTYLIFSPGLWGFPDFDRLDGPFEDPAGKTLYGFHFYAPHNYTHQGIKGRPGGLKYPGKLKMFNGSPLRTWDKHALYEYMKEACEFKERHNVRIFVGEFSVVRWAPGRAQWVEDVCSLFEQYDIDWTYHSYTGWNGWNPTFPAEAPGSNEPDGGVETERLEILKDYWARNTSR